MKSKLFDILNRFSSIFTGHKSTSIKEADELKYWISRKEDEGILTNSHYEYFYTGHFGIDYSFYKGKVILDIGCGPRGSLEWARNARKRIGVDPLAHKYLKLGARKHKMKYLASFAEKIPIKTWSCDAIFSFNSLDHVEEVETSIKEIKRCLRPSGIFLLLVEVNHPPTSCEPHTLSPRYLVDAFAPEFRVENLRIFIPKVRGMYESIAIGETFPDPLNCREKGYLSAKFIRD